MDLTERTIRHNKGVLLTQFVMALCAVLTLGYVVYDHWPEANLQKPKASVQQPKVKSTDFYILNVAAVKTDLEAQKKVQSLRSQGYSANYLWIPDYKSLSGIQLYSVYIGPFQTQRACEEATEAYRKIQPDAYGTLASHNLGRIEIKGLGKVKDFNAKK